MSASPAATPAARLRARLGALAAAGLVLFALGAACRGLARRVRPYTYPPGFSYITPEQLRSSMWVLAAEVKELDERLARPETQTHDEALRREAVADLLRRMDATARALDEPGEATGHPLLDQHLPELRRRIQQALRDVERDPPSYLRAVSVSQSCSLCHARGGAGGGA